MMVYAFNISTGRVLAGGSSRVLGQPRLYSETVLKKKKRKEKNSIFVIKLTGHEDQIKAGTVSLSDLHEAPTMCWLLGFDEP